jgi:uncharacterized protein YtpQ (UPF0354 family)
MSCRNPDVNMQELLEQETAEIIEEDVTGLITVKKTHKDVLWFGNIVRDVGQCVLSSTKMNCFLGKLSDLMIGEQQ